jgi:hypothetical protein
MKKKIIFIIPFLIPFLSACNNIDNVNVDKLQIGLGDVNNLRYSNQAIYFDKVKDALRYHIEIEYKNETVFAKDIKVNQYDVEILNLVGENTVYVTAYNTSKKSKKAKLDFTITNIDSDTIYEGEHGLLSYGDNNASNYRNNPLAHNGAYAGGLDDCGAGLHFDHYSYLAGTRNFEIYYTTDVVNSWHDVYVNGVKQAKAVYSERTGWGGVDKFSPRKVTVEINLEIGWNNIELVKTGTSSDAPQWGGFAEVDYVVIKGTGQEYIVDKEAGIPVFKLQAEMGSAIKWDIDRQEWTIKNPAKYYPEASNHYMLGNIDNEGEGVDIHINVPKRGYYSVQMAYAQDNSFDTFATLYTDEAPRLKVKLPLPEKTGWGTPTLSAVSDVLEFAQDGNHLYIKKSGETGSFEIDYVLLTYVGEIPE